MKKRKKHGDRGIGMLVQCPFWRELEGNRIGCEGITDHCTICLNFDTPDWRAQQERIFCCGAFRNCEIYRAIVEAKYAEEAL